MSSIPGPIRYRLPGPASSSVEPLRYAQVEPTVVAEIQVDTAYEHHRWRHRVRYARPRPDLSVYDVPLILDEGEDLFSDYARRA
ncbi:hypothetical protein [Micromonospora aurantiaca (nom. illeg.)]|uniref:hypothetical protein n=1 Tax=Micromonospora aurantiaca (nom. illeg.) TaxID=47850 RepID=UPI0037B37D30